MAKTGASIATRGMACVGYLAAGITMLFAYQRTTIIGCTFRTNFRDWSSFLFFVIANLIAGGYSLLALWIPSGSHLWRTIVLTDMVVSIVLLSSLAVSSETYYFLNNGSIIAAWTPICNIVHHFCNLVLWALVLSAIGLFLNFGLVFYSLQVSLNPLLMDS